MRNVLALTGKELRTYFVSPMAYVIIAVFLVPMGYLFATMVFFSQESSLRYLFSDMGFILMLLSPILTMRLLAEEQKSGTIELLLTAPVRDIEVVLGKYTAALVFLVAMLALTGYYSFVLWLLGKPDWGPIIGGYVGIFLLGAAYLAVGLLTSSLTQNQIVAAVLSFATLLVFWLITWVADFSGPQFSDIIKYLGMMDHFDDFTKGVIDLKDVVYYVSFIATSLLLTVRVLETRRWK